MKRVTIIAAAMVAATSPASARGLVIVQVPNSGVVSSWPSPHKDGCAGNACWYHGSMTYLRIGKPYVPPQGFQHVTPPGFSADDSCTDSNVYCIPSETKATPHAATDSDDYGPVYGPEESPVKATTKKGRAKQ